MGTTCNQCCYVLADAVLRGYFQGKRYAERVLFESFPEGGVALRPSFVFGTRNVGGVGIPLQAVGTKSSLHYSRLQTCLGSVDVNVSER